jgi:hypothetical protein
MRNEQAGGSLLRDAAVSAQTGKTWAEWFAILDAWNTQNEAAASAARYLHKVHRLNPWWSQAVAARYTQDRNRD